MSRKLGKMITKGTLDSRIKERNIKKTIRKMQKLERSLLFDVRKLLETNQKDQAILLCRNIIDSRKTIQYLGKMRYYVKGIQSFYRQAQLALINNESMEMIGKSLDVVNRVLSSDSVEESMMLIENEVDLLDLNLAQATEILDEYSDPLADADKFVDSVIKEIESAKPEEISGQIDKIISIERILPSIPDEVFEPKKSSELVD